MTVKDKENQLSALWQDVFDEDREVTNLFFENVYGICENPIIENNGEILSSAFLIPCEIGKYKGFYIYCALTHKEHRGKGLMANVLSYADEIRQKSGFDFLLLVPAEKSLFNYYGKFGFVPFGYAYTAKIPEKYNEIRAKYSKARKFSETEVIFPDSVIDFWAEATKHYGGKIIETNGGICLLGEKLLDAKNGVKNNGIAMIKTDINMLKSTSCYVGVTLE